MAEPHRGCASVAIIVGALMMLFLAEGVLLSAKITFDLGTPGTYTLAEPPTCSDRRPDTCFSYAGTFTSDAHATRPVALGGSLEEGIDQGDSVRAFDVGDPDYVFSPEAPSGNPAPFYFAGFGVGLILAVAGSAHLWRHRASFS